MNNFPALFAFLLTFVLLGFGAKNTALYAQSPKNIYVQIDTLHFENPADTAFPVRVMLGLSEGIDEITQGDSLIFYNLKCYPNYKHIFSIPYPPSTLLIPIDTHESKIILKDIYTTDIDSILIPTLRIYHTIPKQVKTHIIDYYRKEKYLRSDFQADSTAATPPPAYIPLTINDTICNVKLNEVESDVSIISGHGDKYFMLILRKTRYHVRYISSKKIWQGTINLH